MYYDEQLKNDILWMNVIGRSIYNDMEGYINFFKLTDNKDINDGIRSIYQPYILRHLFSVWKGLFNTYNTVNTEETDGDYNKLYRERYNNFYEVYNDNIDINNFKDLKLFLDKTIYYIMDEFIHCKE